MVYCVGLGAGEAMHLTFNLRCHYFLHRRTVDGMYREKKKSGKGGEKIVMAVYTRLFQIGCGVT